MKPFLIAPSILSANFARLGEDVSNVISAGADILHFDVMDNHFVPNLSMGPMILKSLRSYGIKIPVDVHLMAQPIDQLISVFADSGADYISIHPESTNHIDKSLQLIKEKGCKVGLVLNPGTHINCLEYVIHKIDLITVMSVNPGFSGQLFLPMIFKKIRQVYHLINSIDRRINLAVDGGINLENFSSVIKSGANVFIIGSAIFNSSNYRDVIRIFRSLLSRLDEE